MHGIGQQRQGDTLVRWGDALLDWVRSVGAAPDEPATEVRLLRASLGNGTDERAQTEVEMEIAGRRASWLMTEAWWAESFVTPTFAQLVSWSVKVVPLTMGLHFARSLQQGLEDLKLRLAAREAAKDKVRANGLIVIALFKLLLGPVLGLVIGMLLSPLLVGLLVLLLVIGLIPISSVRSFVAAMQRRLAGSIGDSLVLLDSPIQAAAIRSRFDEALSELASVCDKVAIVAHSQGAAVAVEALGAGPPASEEKKPPWPPKELTTLITFGAGVNKLELLRRLTGSKARRPEAKSGETVEISPIVPWGISALVAVLFLLGSWTYVEMASGSMTISDFWPILFIVILSVLVMPAVALVVWSADKIGLNKDNALIGAALILFVGPIIWANLYFETRGLVIFGFAAFVFAIVFLNYLVQQIGAVEAKIDLGMPDSVEKWLDLYSSADPVPNGPIRGEGRRPTGVKIFNIGSTLSDHTLYWSNREEFVGLVAAHLAETIGTPFKRFNTEIPAFEAGATRRRARVFWLDIARWITLAAAVFYIWRHWNDLEKLGAAPLALTERFLVQLPLGLDGLIRLVPSAEETVGVILVALTAFVAYGILLAGWRFWDTQDGRDFAVGRPASPYFAFAWFALLVAIAGLASAWLILQEMTQSGGPSLASLWVIFALPGLIIGWRLSQKWLPGAPAFANEST